MLILALLLIAQEAPMTTLPSKSAADVGALFARARAQGRVKTARKTRPVDARPARPGEVVVTIVKGHKETQSRPAESGDWVVRNRCSQTGNEEYLVGRKAFAERYRQGGEPGPDGWQEFHPIGKTVHFLVLTPPDGSFTFEAPWGEPTVAHPGDALVQDPQDEKDTYRVEKDTFACTYEVVD